MDEQKLDRLIGLLDASDDETVGTSMRLPANLREATAIATEMGMASSATALTVRSLRHALEAFVQRAALDAHYREYPQVRPDLADVALALAEVDGNPLADRPDLIRRAATEIVGIKDDPTPDDVLLYAAGLAAA